MEKHAFSTPSITTETLYKISQIITQAPNWKVALDEIIIHVRPIFIFDNLVVYIANPVNKNLDVFYAKATGRGQKAEADVAWGEELAHLHQASDSHQTILQVPALDNSKNRLDRPYLLGIPINLTQEYLGTVVFIRFGGPAFTENDEKLGEFITQLMGFLIERQNVIHEQEILQAQHQQIQIREDFISNISHEFRSPLGFIKGYITTLLRQDTSWDPDTQQEFLRIVDREADRLQELIDNLLDSARFQSGQIQMRFEPIRLEAVINDVIARARQNHPSLVIKFIVKTTLTPIKGDAFRLAQVIENLIGNAIKYAPGSEIQITVEQEKNGILISVRDHGNGIPEKYIPFLFDRFFRVPEQSPNVHGTGLGLFICKQIIHAHNGIITVKSEISIGTTFEIHLPYR